MIYRALARAYGWTPDQVSRLTDKQIAMYAGTDDGDQVEREDDWSKFGLRRDGKYLKGPAGSLEAYMEYRTKLKESSGRT